MNTVYHVHVKMQLGKREGKIDTTTAAKTLKILQADKEYYPHFVSRCLRRLGWSKVKTTAEPKITEYKIIKEL